MSSQAVNVSAFIGLAFAYIVAIWFVIYGAYNAVKDMVYRRKQAKIEITNKKVREEYDVLELKKALEQIAGLKYSNSVDYFQLHHDAINIAQKALDKKGV